MKKYSLRISIFFIILGKYTSSSQQQDEITPNGSQNHVSTTDTNKKLEEITPLFNHQATISSNSVEHDNEPITNAGSFAGRNGAHKINYRKRVKTKANHRKTA